MARPSKISTLTERGQVSIPSHLRSELSLRPGQKLRWKRVDDHVLQVEVLRETEPMDARAMIGFARTFRDDLLPTAEWMKILREGED